MSDLEANRRANRARDELFRTIGRAVPTAEWRTRAVHEAHAGGQPPDPALAGRQGTLPGARQGFATPTATPRRLGAVPSHDAVPRRERPASPNVVPVAIALDPPPTPVRDANALGPQHSRPSRSTPAPSPGLPGVTFPRHGRQTAPVAGRAGLRDSWAQRGLQGSLCTLRGRGRSRIATLGSGW